MFRFFIVLAFLCLPSAHALSTNNAALAPHNGKLIVKFKNNGTGVISQMVTAHDMQTTLRARMQKYLGASSRQMHTEHFARNLVAGGLHQVDLGQGAQFDHALAALKADPDVEFAEPDYIVTADFARKKVSPTPTPTVTPDPGSPPNAWLPNDARFLDEWAMVPAGTQGGSAYGLGIAPLWKQGIQGRSSVIVAIVDTGVDYNHPDLAGNVDRANGYNFVSDTSDALDDGGHGTHVAGIIGAVGNNTEGIAGINWDVTILPIKFLDSSGSGSTSDGIKGIEWAVSHGARVINCSWGGGGYSLALKNAIIAAGKAGVLVVASAGNSGRDTDANPSYPGSFNLSNMISVAATDSSGRLASFSNFGETTVKIGAPGVSILSTYRGSTYRSISGTSMAAPMVTGVAAMVLSQELDATYQFVRDRILNCGSPSSAMRGKSETGKILNAYNSVTGENCE